MLKKVPHKRKIKHFSKKMFFLFVLFTSTFSILCLLYVVFFLPKNRLTSPLAFLRGRSHDTSLSEENSKKVQILLEKNDIIYLSVVPSENNTTFVTLKEKQEVIFANSRNLEQQIASLQLIMRQLTIEGKRFNRIDFRFDNPVVTF